MTAEYRKLPGKRRGFFNLSSVWAGPDHLLLIRGSRFREEYKRFYYRDVQAIAIARAPRFHISTRSGLIAWLITVLAVTLFMPVMVRLYHTGSALTGLGLITLALICVWIYISAAQSCRCRIYTAVSSDELPSVYRLWTARKFLVEVEALIARTQGTIQGEWAAAAEERAVGPAPPPSLAAAPPSALPSRGLASDLFLVSLFMDALVRIAPLHPRLANWLPIAIELETVATAVAVLVQYNRGRLRAGMHRVAVASLIAFGILYYVQGMSAGISASMTAARTGKRTTTFAFQRGRLEQQVGAGIDAILLVVGLLISFRQDEDRP